MFKNNLKALRKRENYTLETLAKDVGSSKAYMWQLENRSPLNASVAIIFKLSQVLNTTMEILLGISNQSNLTEQEHVLLIKYRKLNKKDQDRMIKTIEILLN